MFIFAIAGFLLDILPFFKRMRLSSEYHKEYEDLKKIQYSGKDVSLVTRE